MQAQLRPLQGEQQAAVQTQARSPSPEPPDIENLFFFNLTLILNNTEPKKSLFLPAVACFFSKFYLP